MLVFANGERERALLEGVPRQGDHIRLTRMTPEDPSLCVDQVLWSEVESTTAVEATITVAVTPYEKLAEKSAEADSPEKPE